MPLQTLSFAAQVTDLPSLTDSEFLQALVFDRTSNAALRSAAAKGDIGQFSATWQRLRRAAQQGSTKGTASVERVLWSHHAFPEESGLAKVLIQSCGTAKKSVRPHHPVNKPAVTTAQRAKLFVNELIDSTCSAEPRPFALLAAIYVLWDTGHNLPADQFFRLWRQTLSELLMWPTVTYEDPTVPSDVTLVESGEIPFVGGLFFKEIASAASLVKAGRKLLSKELDQQTDTDGTPHAEILGRLPLWLAPLIRATSVMDQIGESQWSVDQRQLLANVVDRAISLCRPDGRAALTNGMRLDSLPLLTSAAELLGLELVGSTTEYLRSLQRAASGKKTPRRSRAAITTMPSNQSDWAKFALLRSDWSVDADSVAITHHQPLPQLDVTALGRSLIHGDWELKLRLGDAIVELAEEWSCVCWQSDPDADYIELQMLGPGNLRVERLLLLSRKDRFLFVADAISGVPPVESAGKNKSARQSAADGVRKQPQRIEYESRLRLFDGLSGTSEGTTRELRISGNRMKARAFPLAIPQDRVNSTPHQLSIDGSEIVLKQVADGQGLFAPLVFVWHPEQTRVDAVWRTLTVAEDLKVVPPDMGVGYRLKLGDFQLLISRVLKKTGNSRTCLGHHTFNETVIAKFDKNGDVEPILMVE